MSNRYCAYFYWILIVFLSSGTNSHEAETSIIKTSICDPNDFINDSSCTLSCEIYSTSNFVSQWIYTFLPLNEYPYSLYYPLSDLKFGNPGNYSISIELDDYWDGTYICILWTNQINLTQDFHIQDSNTTGVPLGSSCDQSEECGTYNAVCSQDKVCQCPENYPISLGYDTVLSAACLKEAYPEGPCLVTAQCQAGAENFICYQPISYVEYGKCKCLDPYMFTYVSETDRWQCVLKANYSEQCSYNIQCRYYDYHSQCSNGTCVCEDHYRYIPAEGQCQYYDYPNDDTTTVIAAIITFGCTSLVFIGAYCIASKCEVRMRQRALGNNMDLQSVSQPTTTSPHQNDSVPGNVSDLSNEPGLPPSYDEIARSETPPPSFCDVIKPDSEDESASQQIDIITPT